VNYRQALEYTDESLAAAAAAIERLDTLESTLDAYAEDRSRRPDLDDVLAARGRDSRRRSTTTSTSPRRSPRSSTSFAS
jgi:hypothetical protein